MRKATNFGNMAGRGNMRLLPRFASFWIPVSPAVRKWIVLTRQLLLAQSHLLMDPLELKVQTPPCASPWLSLVTILLERTAALSFLLYRNSHTPQKASRYKACCDSLWILWGLWYMSTHLYHILNLSELAPSKFLSMNYWVIVSSKAVPAATK